LIITGQADVIHVWDLTGEVKVRRLSGRGSWVALSPDGKTVAGGGLAVDIRRRAGGTSIDGLDLICLVDVATGEVLHQIKWRGEAVAFSPDGKVLASGCGSWLHLSDFGFIGPNGVN